MENKDDLFNEDNKIEELKSVETIIKKSEKSDINENEEETDKKNEIAEIKTNNDKEEIEERKNDLINDIENKIEEYDENTKEIENSDNFGGKFQLGSTIVEEQRINKDEEI